DAAGTPGDECNAWGHGAPPESMGGEVDVPLARLCPRAPQRSCGSAAWWMPDPSRPDESESAKYAVSRVRGGRTECTPGRSGRVPRRAGRPRGPLARSAGRARAVPRAMRAAARTDRRVGPRPAWTVWRRSRRAPGANADNAVAGFRDAVATGSGAGSS